ncbi:hypothetical protein ES708_09976 [subsurface metagenome]
MGDDAQVVADVQDGRVEFAPQLGDQVQHACLHGHVQGGGRFVHNQEGRVIKQGYGNDHSLLLAAGELMRVAEHHRLWVGHVYPFQHLDTFFIGLFLAEAAVNDQYLAQLLPDAQAWIEGS